MQIQRQPVPCPRQHLALERQHLALERQRQPVATWGQQPPRAGDQDCFKLSSVGSFLLSRLGTCPCSLSAPTKA